MILKDDKYLVAVSRISQEKQKNPEFVSSELEIRQQACQSCEHPPQWCSPENCILCDRLQDSAPKEQMRQFLRDVANSVLSRDRTESISVYNHIHHL